MKIELRADNSVHIEGYVNAVERDSNIINVPSVGRCVEQIRAGAFGRALGSGADVAILENHDTARKLGSISQGNLTLCEDNIGLRASADITDADIAEKARRGELRGWSFGFVCTDSEIEQRAGNVPRRIVKALSLSEVSLIDGAYKPCYNGTLVEVRSEGEFIEYRTDENDTVETSIEERAEEHDYSYYDALMRYLELRYNPYHDDKGRFCSGGGGGGGMLVVPKGQKGKGFYVGMSAGEYAEELLDSEYGTVGEAGTGIAVNLRTGKKNYMITDTNLLLEITHNASGPVQINEKFVNAKEFAQKAVSSGKAEFIPKYKVKELKDKAREFKPFPEVGENVFKEHGWGARQKRTIIRYRRDGSAARAEITDDDPV